MNKETKKDKMNIVETLISLETKFIDLHDSAQEKQRETSDMYWQGKKDGLKIALVLLNQALDDKKAASMWEKALKSSSWYERNTQEHNLEDYYFSDPHFTRGSGNPETTLQIESNMLPISNPNPEATLHIEPNKFSISSDNPKVTLHIEPNKHTEERLGILDAVDRMMKAIKKE